MLRPNITPENTIVGSFITMNPRANLRKIFGEQREVKKTYYLILEENSSQCENFNFRTNPLNTLWHGLSTNTSILKKLDL